MIFTLVALSHFITAQENLPTIEELQQKRDRLQMNKEQFKQAGDEVAKLEAELQAAEASKDESLIKQKKEALEAARKQRQAAFEGLQEMRKERREDIPGYRDYKKQVDATKEPATEVVP